MGTVNQSSTLITAHSWSSTTSPSSSNFEALSEVPDTNRAEWDLNVPGVKAGSLSCSTAGKEGGVSCEEAVSLLAGHDAAGEDLLGYLRCTAGS